MTTEIIELDPLVPDEIEFRYQGKSYVLPGDVSVETTFQLQRLLVQLAAAEEDALNNSNGALDRQEKLTLQVEGVLLELFKQKDPDLESLPFGTYGFRVVLATVLTKLGFGEAEAPPDPPKGATIKKKPPAKKSRRSNTSRS